MDRKRHRCADPRALHALVMVKRTPLGAAVDKVVIDHKAAALADQFRTLIVMDELPPSALRADGFGMILGLLLLLFYFRAGLEGFALSLENFEFFNFLHPHSPRCYCFLCTGRYPFGSVAAFENTFSSGLMSHRPRQMTVA